MKAITKNVVRTALAGLGFTLLLAAPGKAQSEVAPDYYDLPTMAAASQSQAASVLPSQAAMPAGLQQPQLQRVAESGLVSMPASLAAFLRQEQAKLRKQKAALIASAQRLELELALLARKVRG